MCIIAFNGQIAAVFCRFSACAARLLLASPGLCHVKTEVLSINKSICVFVCRHCSSYPCRRSSAGELCQAKTGTMTRGETEDKCVIWLSGDNVSNSIFSHQFGWPSSHWCAWSLACRSALPRYVPTDKLDATFPPWWTSLPGSCSNPPGCTASPGTCTHYLWVHKLSYHWAKHSNFEYVSVCKFFQARTRFISQQEHHRTVEVSHAWNSDTRRQRERTKTRSEYEYSHICWGVIKKLFFPLGATWALSSPTARTFDRSDPKAAGSMAGPPVTALPEHVQGPEPGLQPPRLQQAAGDERYGSGAEGRGPEDDREGELHFQRYLVLLRTRLLLF